MTSMQIDGMILTHISSPEMTDAWVSGNAEVYDFDSHLLTGDDKAVCNKLFRKEIILTHISSPEMTSM